MVTTWSAHSGYPDGGGIQRVSGARRRIWRGKVPDAGDTSYVLGQACSMKGEDDCFSLSARTWELSLDGGWPDRRGTRLGSCSILGDRHDTCWRGRGPRLFCPDLLWTARSLGTTAVSFASCPESLKIMRGTAQLLES